MKWYVSKPLIKLCVPIMRVLYKYDMRMPTGNFFE